MKRRERLGVGGMRSGTEEEKKMRWQTRRKQSSTDKSIYFYAWLTKKQREPFGQELGAESRQKDSSSDFLVNTKLLRCTKPAGMAGNGKARDNWGFGVCVSFGLLILHSETDIPKEKRRRCKVCFVFMVKQEWPNLTVSFSVLYNKKQNYHHFAVWEVSAMAKSLEVPSGPNGAADMIFWAVST